MRGLVVGKNLELELELDSEAAEGDDVAAITDGMILDIITGKAIKDSAKEQVRQRIARAMFHEYGISPDDMAPDFPISVEGKRKRVSIAIFKMGMPHTVENVRRVVICEKEPAGKGVTKMRSHEQAKKDLEQLEKFMAAAEKCGWGLWTNGLELFFLEKDVSRFDVRFKPIGDWPLGDETMGSRTVVSDARMRKADKEMLRVAFRRCHNFIHGNEGMPKDAAFWQFLYLIFAKMHDERRMNGQPRFWAGAEEQFTEEGRQAIADRILPLFDEVKRQYTDIFRGNEEITLSDRALAFMVSELSKYDFSRTDIDAKGTAYQEIVGTNLRGDRGQYFTPRGAIKLMVAMLDPKPTERVFDPACGTGGFLIATVSHMLEQFREGKDAQNEDTTEFLSNKEKIKHYTENYLFGSDFDQFLIRASQMNIVMASNAEKTQLFHMNSLEFPGGYLSGVVPACLANMAGSQVAESAAKSLDGNDSTKKEFERRRTEASPAELFDVIMTNPPFGSDIPISDPDILRQYELGHIWERAGTGGFRNTGRLQGSVAPEVLFIERCISWLKPGGRMGIVLPDGILGNPATEYIRWWIMRNCWVLASIDLPVEVFIVEANVNILTSLLFFKKKTEDEMRAESLGGLIEYPVFMAVAEKVGFDRRGSTIYKRSPSGEELIEEFVETERIRIGEKPVIRTLQRKQKIVDDDLPRIAEAYREFRTEHREPGL